jgi:hypothetical protein
LGVYPSRGHWRRALRFILDGDNAKSSGVQMSAKRKHPAFDILGFRKEIEQVLDRAMYEVLWGETDYEPKHEAANIMVRDRANPECKYLVRIEVKPS